MQPQELDPVPAVVLDVDVVRGLPHVPPHDEEGRRREQVWLVVRVGGEPVGLCAADLPEAGLLPGDLAAVIDQQVGPAVAERLSALRLRPGAAAGEPMLDGPAPFELARQAALTGASTVTVVVCTREQPEGLRRCLDSLLAQEYPAFRVLVVDNAPSSSATREVVAAAAQRGPVDYVVERRPGLSWARNRGLVTARTELVAFLDDDETADRHWLAELSRGFLAAPHVDAVSGVIVPAELETRAQVWFEQFGGHSKGRGFRPAVFGPGTVTPADALFPLPPFGTGANMGFRRDVLLMLGGFDTALGAGTSTRGAEDTLVFTQILLDGGTVAYRPSALTRHYHRRTVEELERQLHGYGVGLTAFYTSLLVERPHLLLPLARLAPRALRELSGGGARTSSLGEDFPTGLLRRNLVGMLAGPAQYARARSRARRLRDLR